MNATCFRPKYRRSALALIAVLAVSGFSGCAWIQKPKPPATPEEQLVQQMTTPPEPKSKRSWLGKILFFWKKEEPRVPKALPMNSIGRIYLFDPERKYAVIESGSAASLSPGTPLVVVKDGSILARLEVSPQSRPPFVVADLKFGKPSKNDLVYIDVQ